MTEEITGIRLSSCRSDSLARRTPPSTFTTFVPMGSTSKTHYFCFIQPLAEHVHLGFEQGVLLDDRFDLLSGDGKQVGVVVLRSVSDCRSPEVAALVQQAAERARRYGG